jgi:tetratricopeptide (TPR) repeat protein
LKLSDEEKRLLTKHYTENTEAYQSYLKGRYFWNRRTSEGYKKGIENFQRAIDIDANYAPAYAGLADCYNLLSEYDILSPNDAVPKAREAALKALALDDTLAEAHTSMAHILMYYDWDWQRAEEEFRRAIQLDPNYATAHQWYAEYLAGMGRFDEATAEMRRALQLDPTSIMLNLMVGWISVKARDYDVAIQQYRRTLEMDPNYPQTHFALAGAYRLKGMYPEAVAEFQKWAALTGDTALLETYLADVYAGWGKQKEARRALRLLEEKSKHRYVSPAYLAYIYASLGNKDRAFQSLEKVCEERVGVLFLKTDPILDSLRSDPRFANLLRRVRLAS